MATKCDLFETAVICPVFIAHQNVQTSYDEVCVECDSFHFGADVSSSTMLYFSETWVDVRRLSIECNGARDMRQITSFWNNVMCTNVDVITVVDIGYTECVIMMNAFFMFGKRPMCLSVSCATNEALLFMQLNYINEPWITIND